MKTSHLSRRDFALVTGAGLVGARAGFAQARTLTAGEILARIKKALDIPWDDKTYRDTFKAGGPETVVKGISSTFMSSLSVLQRSVKAGTNMIITHEPTYWSDPDKIDVLQGDANYDFKRNYAKANNLAIFRLHDHWHARKPDGIAFGWNKRMEWAQYQVNGDQRMWKIPPTTLGELAHYVASRLESGSVRVIGDPATPVTRVGRGGHTLSQNMETMPIVDCVIVSEAREADSHEYLRDVIQSGEKKGAIIIAHQAGEEAGMEEFARWIKPIVPELPVQWIPTNDDFWTL